jgi:plastocyanin
LRPNTNYEFIVNTLPEDDSEHELKITTKQSEETGEWEGVDEGESSTFIFNSGLPGTLSYLCEYHPTLRIGTINVVE